MENFKNKFVCSDHFALNSFFMVNDEKIRSRLGRDAVPGTANDNSQLNTSLEISGIGDVGNEINDVMIKSEVCWEEENMNFNLPSVKIETNPCIANDETIQRRLGHDVPTTKSNNPKLQTFLGTSGIGDKEFVSNESEIKCEVVSEEENTEFISHHEKSKTGPFQGSFSCNKTTDSKSTQTDENIENKEECCNCRKRRRSPSMDNNLSKQRMRFNYNAETEFISSEDFVPDEEKNKNNYSIEIDKLQKIIEDQAIKLKNQEVKMNVIEKEKSVYMKRIEDGETGVEEFNVNQLSQYLNNYLDSETVSKIEEEKINGMSFLELTKEDFKEMNIKIGPQKIILKLISKLQPEHLDCVVENDGQLRIIGNDLSQLRTAGCFSKKPIVRSPRSNKDEALFNVSVIGFSRYQSISETLLQHKQGPEILKAINNNKFGENERQALVRILVAELISYRNDFYPPKEVKWELAKKIVSEFPSLKDTTRTYGCEHYFDIEINNGFIENRLRNARKVLNPSNKKYQTSQIRTLKKAEEETLEKPTVMLPPDVLKEKINWMQVTMPEENEKQNIALVLIETLNNRRQWINKDNPSIYEIFCQYPRLFDYNGTMIEQEFEMEFGMKIAENFIERFTTFYVPRILAYCREKHMELLAKTAFIKDDNLRALIILPELLPITNFTLGKRPKKTGTVSKKQKMSEKTLQQDMPSESTLPAEITISNEDQNIPNSDLLRIFPEGTQISQELERIQNRTQKNIQPSLICIKGQAYDTFFLLGDGFFVELEPNVNPMTAFDRLFKLHYVFNIEYAKSLSFFYNFIECYVCRMKNSKPKSSVSSLNINLTQFQPKQMFNGPTPMYKIEGHDIHRLLESGSVSTIPILGYVSDV